MTNIVKSRPKLSDRLEDGDSILDVPLATEAIWGVERAVAWAAGEPCMIFGPTGVGKTTLIQQIIASGMRVPGLDTDVLGLPVAEFSKPWIYLAADRPNQAKRAWRRLFDEDHRAFLKKRLLVHSGAPGYSLSNPHHIEYLAEDAVAAGAGGIVIDSLKDVTSGLSSDEDGQAIAQSLNALVRDGIEVLVAHHVRKSDGTSRSINEVYGSALITASMGTVVSVSGNPDAGVVAVEQLKYADEAGIAPTKVAVDKRAGVFRLAPESELDAWLAAQNGVTVRDVASFLNRKNGRDGESSPAQIERARRLLNQRLDRPKSGATRLSKETVSGTAVYKIQLANE